MKEQKQTASGPLLCTVLQTSIEPRRTGVNVMLAATVVRSRERAVLLNPKSVRLQTAKDSNCRVRFL